MAPFNADLQENISTQTRNKTAEPFQYKVILLNDDYTTMEFVVQVLIHVFQKSLEEAMNTMLAVHRKGAGLCGIYPLEVAETKAGLVHALARGKGFPLQCAVERA